MNQGAQAMFVVLLILSLALILVFPPLALIACIGIGLYVFLPDDCLEKKTKTDESAAKVQASPPTSIQPPFFGSLKDYVTAKETLKNQTEDATINYEHDEERRAMFGDMLDRTAPFSVEVYRDQLDEHAQTLARRAEITNPDPHDIIIDPELDRLRDEYQELQAVMNGFQNTIRPFDEEYF